MSEELKANLTRVESWKRLLFMLLFAAIYAGANVLIGAVVVFQFGFVLVTNRCNSNLLDLGADLAEFVRQVLNYLTFNSEEKPFPFAAWPRRPERT